MQTTKTKQLLKVASLTALLSCAGALCAKGDTVTNVNLSPYYTQSWNIQINGSTIAAAPKTGNTGTGITFANWDGNLDLVDQGASQTIALAPISLGSNSTANALFNTFYGAYTSEALLTFTNSRGATAAYSLVSGQTIRDYNNDGYPNGLSGSNLDPSLGAVTAQEWWNNGGLGQRLDVQSFLLPSSWAGTNLVGLTIANPSNSGADDTFSALQVVSAAPTPPTPAVPEPATMTLLGTGCLFLASVVRRRLP